LEDLGVDDKIILEWILREIGWECVHWILLAQDKEPVAGCCERGNELSDSIKGGEFLD